MQNSRPFPDTCETADAEQASGFGCVVQHTGRDAAWVRLSGELDLASTSLLARRLDEALRTARLIVVDLRELTFMERASLGVVVAAHSRARRTERRLVLVRGPAQVSRLLDTTGLSNQLEITSLEPTPDPGAR
jgi:anti-anti-sigma factor